MRTRRGRTCAAGTSAVQGAGIQKAERRGRTCRGRKIYGVLDSLVEKGFASGGAWRRRAVLGGGARCWRMPGILAPPSASRGTGTGEQARTADGPIEDLNEAYSEDAANGARAGLPADRRRALAKRAPSFSACWGRWRSEYVEVLRARRRRVGGGDPLDSNW